MWGMKRVQSRERWTRSPVTSIQTFNPTLDVGVPAGEKNRPNPGQVDKVGDAGREHGKKPRAPRIEDRTVAAVNDEILVGGNPLLPGGFAEPQQNELVGSVVVKNFGHGESFPRSEGWT